MDPTDAPAAEHLRPTGVGAASLEALGQLGSAGHESGPAEESLGGPVR